MSAPDDVEDGLTEEWDIAIARALMRSTWANAGGAVLLGILSYCCNPLGLATFLSLGAALNTALRLNAMRAEYRQQVSVAERAAAMLVAAVGGLLSLGGPVLWVIGYLLRQSVEGT